MPSSPILSLRFSSLHIYYDSSRPGVTASSPIDDYHMRQINYTVNPAEKFTNLASDPPGTVFFHSHNPRLGESDCDLVILANNDPEVRKLSEQMASVRANSPLGTFLSFYRVLFDFFGRFQQRLMDPSFLPDMPLRARSAMQEQLPLDIREREEEKIKNERLLIRQAEEQLL